MARQMTVDDASELLTQFDLSNGSSAAEIDRASSVI
jgi:hypothetical protein